MYIEADVAGFTESTVAQAHLIQPADREWFLRRRGKLDHEKLGEIQRALAWVVDLYPE